MDKKEEEIAMLVKTEQELTLTSVYAHLQLRDHSTPLMPFRPLGGTVYLYYNPGKEGFSNHFDTTILTHTHTEYLLKIITTLIYI